MNIPLLKHKAYLLRVDSLRATTQAGSGHPSSCLSAADIMAALFFKEMCYNPENPKQANNDRFILSKGHAAPLLYAAWKQTGIISDEQLLSLRKFNSPLEGHPTTRFYHTEAATGSLGCGLSIGLGIALSAHLDERVFYTYVLLGDSECAEGSIWEAAYLAAYYKAKNLIAILDCNRLGQRGQTIEGHHTEQFVEKFKAFGWHTIVVDGHSIEDILTSFKEAHSSTHKPTIIIAKTYKGYGVSCMQDQENWHGKALTSQELDDALKELETRFFNDAHYNGPEWHHNLPSPDATHIMCTDFELPKQSFSGDMATRMVYGKALTAAGAACKTIVALDAEVKNSTYSYLFEEKFPNRFFECFVAEQNMIGMAIGLASRLKIPFVSTFGAFFTRAFDQIRMAAIGRVPLRLIGSHCGVSIGEDGPSQMALEDIALFKVIPDSIILYPCDATSTYKVVQEMAHYDQGISYLRTTRETTPQLYSDAETFQVGGCKVIRKHNNATALIIAAGITVHEAITAADLLEKENIFVQIIDLYSIKPFDQRTVRETAKNCSNRIIVVEDHYFEGGIGQTIAAELCNENLHFTYLAVREIPSSGTPQELRAWANIDHNAIINAVKKFTQPEF